MNNTGQMPRISSTSACSSVSIVPGTGLVTEKVAINPCLFPSFAIIHARTRLDLPPGKYDPCCTHLRSALMETHMDRVFEVHGEIDHSLTTNILIFFFDCESPDGSLRPDCLANVGTSGPLSVHSLPASTTAARWLAICARQAPRITASVCRASRVALKHGYSSASALGRHIPRRARGTWTTRRRPRTAIGPCPPTWVVSSFGLSQSGRATPTPAPSWACSPFWLPYTFDRLERSSAWRSRGTFLCSSMLVDFPPSSELAGEDENQDGWRWAVECVECPLPSRFPLAQSICYISAMVNHLDRPAGSPSRFLVLHPSCVTSLFSSVPW